MVIASKDSLGKTFLVVEVQCSSSEWSSAPQSYSPSHTNDSEIHSWVSLHLNVPSGHTTSVFILWGLVCMCVFCGNLVCMCVFCGVLFVCVCFVGFCLYVCVL